MAPMALMVLMALMTLMNGTKNIDGTKEIGGTDGTNGTGEVKGTDGTSNTYSLTTNGTRSFRARHYCLNRLWSISDVLKISELTTRKCKLAHFGLASWGERQEVLMIGHILCAHGCVMNKHRISLTGRVLRRVLQWESLGRQTYAIRPN